MNSGIAKLTGLRAGLLAGASAVTLLGSPAQAQDVSNAPAQVQPSAAQATQNSEAPQEIIVTGSRIPSPTLTSPSPLQVVSAKTIENAGATNVQEVLEKIPAVGIPGQTRVSNSQDTNPGLSTVNLRNLGDNRTLVLIDGRRSVAGIPGTSTVDLSMIPAPFVERVDILTGGASAVYGSDAIAGVVNFIYKKHFQGLELNAQTGISEKGDDSSITAGATFGSDFADNRGNVMIFAGWNQQGSVENRNRSRARAGYGSLGNNERQGGATDANLQAAKDIFTPVYAPSSVGPGGIFNFGGQGSRVIASDGTFHSYDPATDGFNSSYYGQIASPTKKLTLATRTNYDVTDSVNVFFESTFVNFRTEGRREASPMRTDSALGAFSGNNGYYPIQFQVTDPNTGLPVILNNPLVPAAVFAAADNRYNQDGINSKDMSFLIRTTMFPPGRRTTPTERDNFRVVLGTDVDLAKDWRLHAYYQYGFTKQHQEMTGLADLNRLAEALQVIPDVFDYNKNGNTTEPICVDSNARAQGCVPIDVYGLNPDGSSRISQAAIDWLKTKLTRDSKQTMQVAAADIDGTLFNLPAGPVQVSVGAEYRKETSRDNFDPLSNEARNGYVQENDISGSFDVKEAYGEIVVPLLANIPFIHNLTFRAAGRLSDYSTVGTVHAWNIGGEWSPIRDIRFRAVYAYAVRAPNIGELFSPASAGITTIVDPCQGVTLTQTGAVAENCRADPGVLANIQANGSFTLTFPDTQGVGIVSSSNENLNPETGRTLTLGAVINPRSIHALRDLTFTADYYDIKLEGAISRVSASTILNHCYAQGVPEFCSLITRRSQPSGAFSIGSVQQIDLGLVNSGGLFTRGLDFTLAYNPEIFGGRAGLSASWTHLLKNGVIPLTGDAYDNTMGEIGSPRDSANVTLNWDNDQFGFTVNNQYIGSQMLDYENYQTRFVLADGSLPDKKYFTIGSKIYTDAQIRYTGIEHYQFYVGVDNLFDVKQPPLYGGPPGSGSVASIWDPIGRRFYAGVRLKF
ncbi:MAG TPA: TonB-dependent receptor [Sphingomonas sp.]|nr:TonB-dependent receptor [Sphingomonas sp.]